jgi:lipoyl(octanoyl) transferase
MSNCINILDLPLSKYSLALKLQKKMHSLRQKDKINDTLIFVEHYPVYTLGVNAKKSNIIASQEYIKKRKIEIIKTNRGGDVTFHGPGQLIGYPIIYLKKQSAAWYVNSIEEVCIKMLSLFGIKGERVQGKFGVWVNNEKILAIGVKISKWITMHGFALNIKTDLSFFEGIIPCGIQNAKATSMEKILGKKIDINTVKKTLIKSFMDIFSYDSYKKTILDKKKSQH